MQDIVMLEWTFTPEDYFEDVLDLHDELYDLNITNGKIEARIDPSHYDAEYKIRDNLHQKVETIFLARQLLLHKSFNLSKSIVYRLYPDGRRDGYAFVEGISICISVATADAITTDKDGNVISDTHRDRIEVTNAFVQLVAKHYDDPLLKSLLHSYGTSVDDFENEFVRLYEIRDALSIRFSGEDATRKILNIQKSDWSRLGLLANDEPLTQGRHRGKKAPNLRSATAEELKESRDISKKFIEAYINYLESQEK